MLLLVCRKCKSTSWETEITPKGDGTNRVKTFCKQCGWVAPLAEDFQSENEKEK